MHICHITINPIVFERRILNQADSARDAGHKVMIVSLDPPDKGAETIQFEYEVCPLKTPFHKGGVLKFLHFNWKVFRFLLDEHVEIIHCHDLWVLPAAVILSLLKKCPLIYDAHEFYSGLEVFNRNKIRKNIWMTIEYLAIPRVSVLITVSEPLVDLYRKKYHYLKESTVIRNLPKTEQLPDKREPLIDTPEPVILFQGHFRPGRGLFNLLEAFSQTEGIHLVMIGGGELEEELKKIVKSKNLEKRVSFLGYIPTTDLIQTTARADLGIALFEPTSINYTYALPNKFFEYIMAGIPVMASNIDTLKDYIDSYKVGLTVDPSDVPGIRQTILDMIINKNKIIQWRENARKASTELNWESEARKMNQIYEKVGK